jgi:predicted enzyme related to lactoylglutathione lyase
MPRVVHFELSAENPERAVKFYTDVFGWEIKKWDGPHEYWLVTTGTPEELGINGGIMRRQGTVGSVNTVGVSNVEDFADKITEKGGQIVMPKMTIPGVGYLIYCKDTEDNIFGILQPDQGAK